MKEEQGKIYVESRDLLEEYKNLPDALKQRVLSKTLELVTKRLKETILNGEEDEKWEEPVGLTR